MTLSTSLKNLPSHDNVVRTGTVINVYHEIEGLLGRQDFSILAVPNPSEHRMDNILGIHVYILWYTHVLYVYYPYCVHWGGSLNLSYTQNDILIDKPQCSLIQNK